MKVKSYNVFTSLRFPYSRRRNHFGPGYATCLSLVHEIMSIKSHWLNFLRGYSKLLNIFLLKARQHIRKKIINFLK